MKNNVKFISIITCCVAPNMGPLRGPKHGTTAWPQTWDLRIPHPWDGVIACFPENFVFDFDVNFYSKSAGFIIW